MKPTKRHYRGLTSRNAILLCVAAALLAAASIHACLRSRRPSLPPDRLPAAIAFTCQACGKRFDMTPQDIDKALRSAGLRSPRETGGVGMPCPYCGAWAGIRADTQPD